MFFVAFLFVGPLASWCHLYMAWIYYGRKRRKKPKKKRRTACWLEFAVQPTIESISHWGLGTGPKRSEAGQNFNAPPYGQKARNGTSLARKKAYISRQAVDSWTTYLFARQRWNCLVSLATLFCAKVKERPKCEFNLLGLPCRFE